MVNSFPDRTLVVNGMEFLCFGGTAYLGLSTNPEFQQMLSNSIKEWGTSYGSSRDSNVQLAVYDKFEKLFAYLVGSEASISTSSGTLAGNLVINYLKKSIGSFYHYPKSHPSVLASNSLPMLLDGKLNPKLLDRTVEEVVITADTVLSEEVYPTSFEFLKEIPSQKKITLIIDESHSLGLLGSSGEGIYHTVSNLNLHRKILISSLGKAFSLSGGIIAADMSFIDAIKKEAVFIASSGANPAYLNTYIAAQDLIKTQRKKLHSNLDFFFKNLELSALFKYNENYPVIYCSKEDIYDRLLEKGIIISHFKYPTYKGVMNRIVITANHTKEDLVKLKDILKKYR